MHGGIEVSEIIQRFEISIFIAIYSETNVSLKRYWKRNVSIFYFHNCLAITLVPPRYTFVHVERIYTSWLTSAEEDSRALTTVGSSYRESIGRNSFRDKLFLRSTFLRREFLRRAGEYGSDARIHGLVGPWFSRYRETTTYHPFPFLFIPWFHLPFCAR